VAIGDVRVVGKIVNGVASFEPGENQAGDYFIITKAFWFTTYKLAWKIRLLEIEIERLKAKDKNP
jgi:hypothetical protein